MECSDTSYSSRSSCRVREQPRNTKSMRLPLVAIFSMTYFYRTGRGMVPLATPRSTTVMYTVSCDLRLFMGRNPQDLKGHIKQCIFFILLIWHLIVLNMIPVPSFQRHFQHIHLMAFHKQSIYYSKLQFQFAGLIST